MGHDLYSTTRDIYGDHDLLDNKSHHDIAAKIEQQTNQSNYLYLMSWRGPIRTLRGSMSFNF